MKNIFIRNYRNSRLTHPDLLEAEHGTLPMLSSQVFAHVMENSRFPLTLNDDEEELVDIGVIIKDNAAAPFLFVSTDNDTKIEVPSEVEHFSSSLIQEEKINEISEQFDLAKQSLSNLTGLAQVICRDFGGAEVKHTSEMQLQISIEIS